MNANTFSLLALTLSVAGAAHFTGCASRTVGAEAGTREFLSDVKPVLEKYCIECHNGHSAREAGGLNLESRELAFTTGRQAPVIQPGDPHGSLLYKVLRLGHEEVLGMPPTPERVSDEELAAVRKWIRQGAHWPAGPEGMIKLQF
jgi:mono/diheme cytochrome c family protein